MFVCFVLTGSRSGTFCLDQSGLTIRDPSASASRVLGLRVVPPCPAYSDGKREKGGILLPSREVVCLINDVTISDH